MSLTLIALAARAVCGPRPRLEPAPLQILMRRYVRADWTDEAPRAHLASPPHPEETAS